MSAEKYLSYAERLGMFKLTWNTVKSVLWHYRGTIASLLLISVLLGFVPTIKSELESGLIDEISRTISGRNSDLRSGVTPTADVAPQPEPWIERAGEAFSIELSRFRVNRADEGVPEKIARTLFGGVSVGRALLAYLVLSLLAYAVDFSTTVLQTKVSREVFSRLRQVGLQKGLVTDPSRLPAVSNVAGQYANAIQVGAVNVGNTYGYLLDAGQHFLSLSTALFLVFTKSRPFAVACLIIVALQVWLSYSQGRRLRLRRNDLDTRRNDLLARTDDVLSKREIILAYEQQGRYGEKIEGYSREFAEVGRKLDIWQKLYELSSRLVTDYGRMIILLVGLLVSIGVAGGAGGGQVGGIGDAYFFISIYTRILFPATDLLRKYDGVKESESTSRTFLAVLGAPAPGTARAPQPLAPAGETASAPALPPNGASGASVADDVRAAEEAPAAKEVGISFRDVYFKYPALPDSTSGAAAAEEARHADAWVLRGCSFDAPARKTTLVLGRSGCGKSTIARILLGFWRPTSGEVTVCGCPLAAYDGGELRELMAYVSQGDHVIDDTVRDNLRWGHTRDGRQISDTEMLGALAAMGIIRSPVGQADILDKLARDLSGGQQQRLSFARMMLDESDIVILDEPFAGVDIFTIRDLRPYLKRVFDTQERTVLMFSHRLAFAAYADHVIIIGDDGAITEEGQPAELLLRAGMFAQLYAAARDELDIEKARAGG